MSFERSFSLSHQKKADFERPCNRVQRFDTLYVQRLIKIINNIQEKSDQMQVISVWLNSVLMVKIDHLFQ